MKNKTWIIIAAVFAVIMLAAVTLYPKLAEKHTVEEQTTANSVTSETENFISSVKADSFTVYDSEMNSVELSDFFGKPIVVNFWASWCGPCKSELPAFNNMYEKYKNDVTFLMVNVDNGQSDIISSISNFVSESGYSFPVYYDLEFNASNTYGVYSIPESLFINADGTLYEARVGAMSENILESYIKNIAGESK